MRLCWLHRPITVLDLIIYIMSFSAGYQCFGCSQWAFGPGCSEPSDEKQDNIGDCSPIKHGSKCPSNCTLFWWEDCRTWYPLWIIGKGGSICFIGWHSKAGIWVTLTLLELTVVLNEHVLVYVWGAELDGIAWHLLLFFKCLTHIYFCFKFFFFHAEKFDYAILKADNA